MVFSAIATAVGAVMYWAVTYQGTGFRISTVGVILMIAGVAGFIVSSIVFSMSRQSVRAGHHTMDRQVVDPQGHVSSLHEETKG
jgi:phosphate/sulfate permease